MKFRMRQSWRWLVALGAVFVPAVVSGALELPFTFKAGGAIKASEVNANFAALQGKLNALAGGSLSPVIGSVTLAGILTDAPIRKFSQAIDVPWTQGVGGAAKPQVSEIVIERDSGEGTPPVSLSLCQNKVLATASIVLGNLKVDLNQVFITGVTRTTPPNGPPQEAISLGFSSVKYTWAEPNLPEVNVSYDVVKAVGGGSATQAFLFGYFPANVTPDASYLPIQELAHSVACPAGGGAGAGACKPQHSPVSITKAVGADLLDALSLAFSGKQGSTVDIDVFSDETTISNSIELDGVLVTGVALSSDASGVLNEKVSFGYQTINWKAGNVSQGWDVAAGKAL